MQENEVGVVFEKMSKTFSLTKVFHENDIGSRAIWSCVTELLFLLTPLLIIAFMLTMLNKISIATFFGLSDFSLLSTFIFGQSAIKVLQFPQDTFVLRGNEVISGLVALVVCFGVLPSAILFALSFNSLEKSTYILWTQPVLLMASVIIYFIFAFISNAANILKSESEKEIVARSIAELNKPKT